MKYLAKDFNVGFRVVPKVEEPGRSNCKRERTIHVSNTNWSYEAKQILRSKRETVYFMIGTSASGQARPTMHAKVKPSHVLSKKNHMNSAPANNM